MVIKQQSRQRLRQQVRQGHWLSLVGLLCIPGLIPLGLEPAIAAPPNAPVVIPPAPRPLPSVPPSLQSSFPAPRCPVPGIFPPSLFETPPFASLSSGAAPTDLAVPYAALGQVDRALALANQSADNPVLQAIALTKIAGYQSGTAAETTLTQALKIARSLQDSKDRQYLLRLIAVEYAAQGKLEPALQLVQPLSQNHSVISQIARRYIRDRQDKAAVELIRNLPKYVPQDRNAIQQATLQAMLEQAVQSGRAPEVVAQILPLTDDCLRQTLVFRIADANDAQLPSPQQNNWFKTAIALAQSIQDPTLKAESLESVAEGFLRAHQPEAGLQLATAMLSGNERDQVLSDIGSYYLSIQQPDKALGIFNQMRDLKANVYPMQRLLMALIDYDIQHGAKDKAAALLSIATQQAQTAQQQMSLPLIPGALQRSP